MIGCSAAWALAGDGAPGRDRSLISVDLDAAIMTAHRGKERLLLPHRDLRDNRYGTNGGRGSRMKRRCIVVDTNALWDDLRLTGIAWQVLAAATADSLTCLRFSATVLDEAKAKYAEQARAEANHLADKTSRYLADTKILDPIIEALSDSTEQFADYLEDRILEGLKAEILPYPDSVTHAEMTERALLRKPPFNQTAEATVTA